MSKYPSRQSPSKQRFPLREVKVRPRPEYQGDFPPSERDLNLREKAAQLSPSRKIVAISPQKKATSKLVNKQSVAIPGEGYYPQLTKRYIPRSKLAAAGNRVLPQYERPDSVNFYNPLFDRLSSQQQRREGPVLRENHQNIPQNFGGVFEGQSLDEYDFGNSAPYRSPSKENHFSRTDLHTRANELSRNASRSNLPSRNPSQAALRRNVSLNGLGSNQRSEKGIQTDVIDEPSSAINLDAQDKTEIDRLKLENEELRQGNESLLEEKQTLSQAYQDLRIRHEDLEQDYEKLHEENTYLNQQIFAASRRRERTPELYYEDEYEEGIYDDDNYQDEEELYEDDEQEETTEYLSQRLDELLAEAERIRDLIEKRKLAESKKSPILNPFNKETQYNEADFKTPPNSARSTVDEEVEVSVNGRFKVVKQVSSSLVTVRPLDEKGEEINKLGRFDFTVSKYFLNEGIGENEKLDKEKSQGVENEISKAILEANKDLNLNEEQIALAVVLAVKHGGLSTAKKEVMQDLGKAGLDESASKELFSKMAKLSVNFQNNVSFFTGNETEVNFRKSNGTEADLTKMRLKRIPLFCLEKFVDKEKVDGLCKEFGLLQESLENEKAPKPGAFLSANEGRNIQGVNRSNGADRGETY